MRERRYLKVDQRASGYMESIFAIMVISVALTTILASISVIDSPHPMGHGLEDEAEALSARIISILSDDGLTVESENIARVDQLDWEPIAALGMRADIHVLGSEPSDWELIFLGILPESVDSCYSSRTPIIFIEDDSEVKAAVLMVVVW